MYTLLVAVLATVGCSSDNGPSLPESGTAQVQFGCVVAGEIGHVEARATTGYALPSDLLPSADAFTLALTGTYTDKVDAATTAERTYSKSWATLADYKMEAPALETGVYDVAQGHYANSYRATVTCGDPMAEGEGKPYFEGASEEIILYAGKSIEAPVTARLANSCFSLYAEQYLLSYYTGGVELTIHTADNAFTFNPTTTAESALIFVKPGQQLSISGKAVKQNGTEVTFAKTAIGAGILAAETHYAVRVDHATAGSGALMISFDGSFTEVPAVEVELNPDEN
jgi:hypothetical protein